MKKISSSLRTLEAGRLVKERGPYYMPTPFGSMVSQLYILPSTGVKIREGLDSIGGRSVSSLGYLHLLSTTPDMIKFTLYKRERSRVKAILQEEEYELVLPPPGRSRIFSYSYLEYLQEFKTALTLREWIRETSEDAILEKHSVQPGDLHAAAYTGEWLLHASSRLARLLGNNRAADDLSVLSERMRYGIKAELLDLVSLEGIGRVRARNLFDAGYKTLKDLDLASLGDLERIPAIGPRVAENIKRGLRRADIS
jgi:helicase